MVDDTPWLDDVEMRAWRNLLTVYKRILVQLDADLQKAQLLSLADYAVLVTLSEAPDRRLRMVELADRILVTPSGLTRRVDALVRHGLVSRQPCPDDRRGTFAVLTGAGLERLRQAAPHHVVQVRRRFFDHLDRRQVAALDSTMEVVRAALDRLPSSTATDAG